MGWPSSVVSPGRRTESVIPVALAEIEDPAATPAHDLAVGVDWAGGVAALLQHPLPG
jgi:hypothetical protein